MEISTKPADTAILVIDVQNDYCSKDGVVSKDKHVSVEHVSKTISEISKFIVKARKQGFLIIFTKIVEDYRHMAENAAAKINSFPKKYPPICAPGTWGFDYYQIKPEKTDFEVIRNTYDAFASNELEKILIKNKIRNLIIIGGYAAVSVDSTVRTAFTKGYNIIIPRDLIYSPKEWVNEGVFITWHNVFAYVVKSKEIEGQ